MTTEIALFLIFVDLILPQLILCGTLYMVWWMHRPFIAPFLYSVSIFFLCFSFKYAFGEKKDLDSPFKTCFILTIPKFTLPSVHSALAIYLCIHFTLYYLKSVKKNSILIQEPAVTNWPRFRVAVVWLYFGLVCFARIYLRLNDILDIIIGAMIGLIGSFAESWMKQGEKKLKNGD